eukprot:SAG31_NODE_4016_length_3662_cov_3.395453_3_plen_124_part_00
MIAHPAVVQRLNWMLGPGYSEAFEPMACNYITGTCGGSLHAGPRHGQGLSGAALGFGLENGRAYCEASALQTDDIQMRPSWLIFDCNTGGECIVGSWRCWSSGRGMFCLHSWWVVLFIIVSLD